MRNHNLIQNLILTLLFLSFSFSKIITIQGVVVDNDNSPISNVNIFSGLIGTSTPKDGSFEIKIDESSIVTFTHIAYLNLEYKASEIPQNITLSKNILKSSQVIVSGFSDRKLSESNNTVNIITNNEIKYGRENHFKDLISKVPNLTFAGGTSNPRYFLIRGIGEISQFSTEGNPNFSIGYIIDDVDYSGIASIGATFGLEQVEVFKGPQNYIFGPNAMAGVINIKSLKPTPYLSTKAIIGANSDQGYNVGLSISNSLTNSIAYRITGYTNYSNGFIYNAFYDKDNTNKNDESFLRTKLVWEPSKKSTLSLMGFKSIQNNGYDVWSPDNNGDTTYTDFLGIDNLTANSYSISYKYRLSTSSIELVTTLSEIELDYDYDGDWGNNTMWESAPYYWDSILQGYPWSFNDITNRNRITKTTDLKYTKKIKSHIFTLGAYFKSLKEDDYRKGFLLGAKAESVNTSFDITNKSIYSNLIYNLSEKLIFNLGSRYSDYSNSYTGEGLTSDENWNPVPIESIDESLNNQMIGAHVSINYKINEKLNLYSAVSRGYKAGGINQNPYLSDSQRFFKPEYNININTGIGYLRDIYEVNINLFYMKRSDQQVGLYYQLDPSNPLSFTFYTANAIDGYNSGLETMFKFYISDDLSITLNNGLLKNHVNTFLDPFDKNVSYGDREPAHSPSFNYSVLIDYTLNNGLNFSIENTGMDKFFFDDQASIKSDPYSVINFNIGYRITNWHISIWGKNILNKKYASRGYFFDLGIGNQGEQVYKAFENPSHFGASIEYNF